MLENSSKSQTKRRILLIYTGGTIGMIKDATTGILGPFDFSELKNQIPEINQLSAEVEAVAFEKPIDSSDMDPTAWSRIATFINKRYSDFDGFVILHGSDTMAFTASALSFMFRNLSKPVILTGSQLPIGVVRTDGKENIITAIEIASDYENGKAKVPEVAIYFEYQLYRGNRTYKYNTAHFEAFRSPNYPTLAEAGVHIVYNQMALMPIPSGTFEIDTELDNRIAILSLFPGISEHIVKAALTIPDNKVLFIRTYGSGNAMTAKWFLNALEEAIKNGLYLINISQCRGGGVLQGRYETSIELERMGVISAGDMIIEAAVTKAMFLLAKNLTPQEFREKFTENMRGELTVNQIGEAD